MHRFPSKVLVPFRLTALTLAAVASAVPCAAQRAEVVMETGVPLADGTTPTAGFAAPAFVQWDVNSAGDWLVHCRIDANTFPDVALVRNGTVERKTGDGLTSTRGQALFGQPILMRLDEQGSFFFSHNINSQGPTGVDRAFYRESELITVDPVPLPANTGGPPTQELFSFNALDVSPFGTLVTQGSIRNIIPSIFNQGCLVRIAETPVGGWIVTPGLREGSSAAFGACILASAEINDFDQLLWSGCRGPVITPCVPPFIALNGTQLLVDDAPGPFPGSTLDVPECVGNRQLALSNSGDWLAEIGVVDASGTERTVFVNGDVEFVDGDTPLGPHAFACGLVDGGHDIANGGRATLSATKLPQANDGVIVSGSEIRLRPGARVADGRTISRIDFGNRLAVSAEGNFAIFGAQLDCATSVNAVVRLELDLGGRYGDPSMNSTGHWSDLRAYGTTSLTTNDLTFDVTNTPPSTFGFLLASQTRVAGVPLAGGSEGVLLLGGQITRVLSTITLSDALGAASMPLDVTLPMNGGAPIAAGETWQFQYWHRDVNALGQTSNTSNGVTLAFE